jgi:hypothetical protein
MSPPEIGSAMLPSVSKLKLVALALVLVLALGGVLHESLIHHSLADLDHAVGSRTCAVCQALQHNASFVSGALTAEPALLVQSDAYTPVAIAPSSSVPALFASRAPPVLS